MIDTYIGQFCFTCGLGAVCSLIAYGIIVAMPSAPDTVKRHEEIVKKLEEIKEEIKEKLE